MAFPSLASSNVPFFFAKMCPNIYVVILSSNFSVNQLKKVAKSGSLNNKKSLVGSPPKNHTILVGFKRKKLGQFCIFLSPRLPGLILQCQTFATCIGLTWAHDKSIICAKNALSCACNLSIWVVCHTFNQRSFLSHLHNIFIGFHGAHMTKKKNRRNLHITSVL